MHKVDAPIDYDAPHAGLFEGGYAQVAGEPLWLHLQCGRTWAGAGVPVSWVDHDECGMAGEWSRIVVPSGAVTRPPRDVDYLERRARSAMRYGPGNTVVERVFRWRGPAGELLDTLPASRHPGDYSREVCVRATSVSGWQEVQP